jgi:DNA (cytosine-5)-methyltransferase 1
MLSYISLFSSAGVGCHGLKNVGFDCAATVELIERRINVQKANNKCSDESGYICGDLTDESVQSQLRRQASSYCSRKKVTNIDLIIATPPCQGISVANHKKNNREIVRNSLVLESLKIIDELQPKYFILENVRGFLKAACLDTDGTSKSIFDALQRHLFETYRFSSRVVNFKDFGSKSSRTRTLVIGVRRDIKDCSPEQLFPDKKPVTPLGDVIGHLPRLEEMGKFNSDDYLHSFRPYKKHMEPWIAATKYGMSAFDNEPAHLKPHQVKDGEIVVNKSKNSDKYKRQKWEDVGPCIHTRNDCLPSQNTIHPEDNRVFSIRELMLMMTIPDDFQWLPSGEEPVDDSSFLQFHKKHDVNIRQCIGEAVPTSIFSAIAEKIKATEDQKRLSKSKINELVDSYSLQEQSNLHQFIVENPEQLNFQSLMMICEVSNANRQANAAYYTRQDSCFDIINELPDFSRRRLRILEPSVGIGNFLYAIAAKYFDKEVIVDCVDIDEASLETCALLAERYLPRNVELNFIHSNYLTCENLNAGGYDLVIGNPPYKEASKEELENYRPQFVNQKTKNLFNFFIEKSLQLSSCVALIIPKTFLDSPQYAETRAIARKKAINAIVDFGETAFDVKIETIGLVVSTNTNTNSLVHVYSHRLSQHSYKEQTYITNTGFDAWLIYRNSEFDRVATTMSFGKFSVFRDRQISKAVLKNAGEYRVIKSKNIGDNKIIYTDDDKYIEYDEKLSVFKFLNQQVLLVPNLTYNPRAAWLPKGCIPDGSAAILVPSAQVTDEQIEYFSSTEFREFYQIARNYSTRSMNIDNSSVKYFGIKESQSINVSHSDQQAAFELAL